MRNDKEYQKCVKFVLEHEKEGEEAYLKWFYDHWPVACDRPWPLNVCMLDTAVIHGNAPAVNYFNRCKGDWKKYLELRWEYYNEEVAKNPTLRKDLGIWKSRINDLKKFISITDLDDSESQPTG